MTDLYGTNYDSNTPDWCDEHADMRTNCGCRLPGFAGTVLPRSALASVPAVQPMIDGVLSRPSAAVLVGSYGVGKTFLSLGMAASIATGRGWLGRAVHASPVLYVIGEGASGMHDRISAWEDAWNEGNPIPDNRLQLSVKPGSLAEDTRWSEIKGWAASAGVGAVFLDTLSSLAPDADETRDAARIMRQLSDLASKINGPAVLVHHPGWSDNGRVRGGYQFEANADEVLVLTGTVTEPLITLEVKKRKDGVSGQRLWLRRKEHAGSMIVEHANAHDAEVPIRERIEVILGNYAGEGCSATNLLAELDATDKGRSSVYRALNRLRGEGVVAKEDRKHGARYWLTALVPAGVTIDRENVQ